MSERSEHSRPAFPRGESPVHAMVDAFLATHPPPAGEEHPCPYLPGRTARNRGFSIDRLRPDVYRAFMDRGFRRSGDIVYRTACPGCTRCRPLRVFTADFRPSRSQRRVRRTNRDLTVTVHPDPQPTDDKWRLFKTYVQHQHGDAMATGRDDFDRFLYRSPTRTIEITYALEDRLVGVGIADRCPGALSSVYMFFDPAHRRRSLGTFSILWEIDYCRRRRIPYYYLGYYVPGSRNMAYKARFRPHQLLDDANVWHSHADATSPPADRGEP